MSNTDDLQKRKKELEAQLVVAAAKRDEALARRDEAAEQLRVKEAELEATQDAIRKQEKVISALEAERDAAVARRSNLEAEYATKLSVLDAEIATKRQEQEQLQRNLDEAWANVKRRDEEIKRTQGQ